MLIVLNRSSFRVLLKLNFLISNILEYSRCQIFCLISFHYLHSGLLAGFCRGTTRVFPLPFLRRFALNRQKRQLAGSRRHAELKFLCLMCLEVFASAESSERGFPEIKKTRSWSGAWETIENKPSLVRLINCHYFGLRKQDYTVLNYSSNIKHFHISPILPLKKRMAAFSGKSHVIFQIGNLP